MLVLLITMEDFKVELQAHSPLSRYLGYMHLADELSDASLVFSQDEVISNDFPVIFLISVIVNAVD